MQSPESVERQFKLLEEFLKVWLILRVTESCRPLGRQPFGTERLKFHGIRSSPLRRAYERECPFLVTAVVEARFCDDVDPIRIVLQQAVNVSVWLVSHNSLLVISTIRDNPLPSTSILPASVIS